MAAVTPERRDARSESGSEAESEAKQQVDHAWETRYAQASATPDEEAFLRGATARFRDASKDGPEPVQAILERLVPHDHDQLLDLAQQLPPDDVRHIAAKIQKRRRNISDIGGYLRCELERKLHQHRRLAAHELSERTAAMIQETNGQIRAERDAIIQVIRADPDRWAATEGAAMNDPGFEIQLAALFSEEQERIRLRDVRATALRKDER